MKGQAYSLVAVLIMVPLMLYIGFYMTSSQELKTISIERIVSDQLHQMERSVQKDFEKAMEISVKRAALAATSEVIKNGVYLDDADLRIWELVTNGTLYGNESFTMFNNTIGEWRDKIIALNPGYNLNIEYFDSSISSQGGFNIRLGIKLITNVSDKLGIAKIDKYVGDREVLVSVEGTEDPIFPVNTMGYVGRKIRIFPYPFHALKIETGSSSGGSCQGNVTFDPLDPDAAEKILITQDSAGVSGFLGIVSENVATPSVSCYLLGVSGAVEKINYTLNISGYNSVYIDNQTTAVWSLPIRKALEEGYYASFPVSGPDMLMRIEGNLNQADGFETFVNIPDLQSVGLPVDANKVSIAYIYFSSQDAPGSPVRGLQSWFRMDAANAGRYNLTELM